MSRVALVEHSDTTLPLAPEDVAHLLGIGGRWIAVRPAPAGVLTLNPGSTVGVLRLPSGLQLELRPKVPLRNLLWMLSEVHDLPFRTLPEQVALERFEQVIELVADAFARLVERRIDLGLYRDYIEEEDDLPAVRGRILVAQDIHRNAILRHRTWCRYTTYAWDIPENQVIRQVVHLLAGWGLSRPLTGRLLALDGQMDAITHGRFTAADVDRFVYTRQSQDYRPIHRLCRLFLEGASLAEDRGAVPFDGFLLDMNALFERFVTRGLAERLPPPLRLSAQHATPLDVGQSVAMRPDIVLQRNGAVVLAGDCKYKALGAGEHRHHDLYQLLAYTTALDVPNGVLIYPRHLVDIATAITVRNTGHRLRETTIDLGGPPTHVRAELDALAARVARWAGTPMAAPPG